MTDVNSNWTLYILRSYEEKSSANGLWRDVNVDTYSKRMTFFGFDVMNFNAHIPFCCQTFKILIL